jgi:hypothetical protein
VPVFQVGAATSIYADHAFDPQKTLLWAKQHKANPVQLYLNRDLLTSVDELNGILRTAANLNLDIVAHAPEYDLFDEKYRSLILTGAQHIMQNNGWRGYKPLVWHMNPQRSFHENRIVHRFITEAGLTSAPENNIHFSDPAHVQLSLHQAHALWNLPGVLPVLDLPRYFVLTNPTTAELLAVQAIECLPPGRDRIIHLINGNFPLTNRKHWCSPQHGIIPWNRFFSLLRTQEKQLCIILEYEDRTSAEQALVWLRQFS